jgi:hypothetical protein
MFGVVMAQRRGTTNGVVTLGFTLEIVFRIPIEWSDIRDDTLGVCAAALIVRFNPKHSGLTSGIPPRSGLQSRSSWLPQDKRNA